MNWWSRRRQEKAEFHAFLRSCGYYRTGIFGRWTVTAGYSMVRLLRK